MIFGYNAPVELRRLISVVAGFNSPVSDWCESSHGGIGRHGSLKSFCCKACGFKSLCEQIFFSQIAQLVERVTVNHQVGGSSPSLGV